MNAVSELKKTRKMLLSISQISLILIIIVLISQWFVFNKIKDKEQRVFKAKTTLRQAENQLESYKLDSEASLFQLEQLNALSPLPKNKKFKQAFKQLDSAQIYLNGLIQSESAWKELTDKSNQAFIELNTQCNNLVATSKYNTEFSLSILEAAQTIKHILKSPPASQSQRENEVSMLDFQIKKADSLVHADTKNPQTIKIRQNWTNWMTITQEQLLEEKSFYEQKKAATSKLTSYAMVLQNEALKHQKLNKSYSLMYSIMLLSLALLALITQRAIYKNPHLNTMLSPRGKATVLAEANELSASLRELNKFIANMVATTKTDLNKINNMQQDTEAIDTQTRALKSITGSFLTFSSTNLQKLETQLRSANLSEYADKLGDILGNIQSDSANLAQALETLGDSNISLQGEINNFEAFVNVFNANMQKLDELSNCIKNTVHTLKSAIE
ncbi:MAG: hypothetical protein GX801_02625 [Fibrobacter sp.]|nr:hypothetical protein [Fibrobacter sp.]